MIQITNIVINMFNLSFTLAIAKRRHPIVMVRVRIHGTTTDQATSYLMHTALMALKINDAFKLGDIKVVTFNGNFCDVQQITTYKLEGLLFPPHQTSDHL